MAELPGDMPKEIGDFTLHPLSGGEVFKLDGGTMFGVVPKTLWGRVFQADEQNRVAFTARPLLVTGPGGPILVDGGCGRVSTPKMIEIFGIRADQSLLDRMRKARVEPENVRLVVASHLHFDHVGGLVEPNPAGGFALAFPQARTILRRGELERALAPNELTKASYLPEIVQPLARSERLTLLGEEDVEIVPGVTLVRTGGHTRDHQIVIVRSRGETAVFWGDLVPTAFHARRPNYVSAFDLYPLETLEAKKRLLPLATFSVYYHSDSGQEAGASSP